MAFIAAGYFWLGYEPWLSGQVAPINALEVRVLSEQGRWRFEYPTGEVSNNVLAVPRSQAVRLLLSSGDQLHGLYLPEFGIAETAIPGRYTSAWFRSEELTSAPIRCLTFCPENAESPLGSVAVLEPVRFEQWLSATRKTQSIKNTNHPEGKQ
jgi:cytochrome c oxidase subunit 2